jgi:hypothetical protein
MQKTITLPQSLVDEIGAEYAGTYTVRMLMSKEYLAVTERLIQEERERALQREQTWTGELPRTLIQRGLVYAACQKDGKPLPDDVPVKLYELLASAALPMNTLSQAEGQELYSLFR